MACRCKADAREELRRFGGGAQGDAGASKAGSCGAQHRLPAAVRADGAPGGMSIANLCSRGTSKELTELGKPVSGRRAADWRVPPCASTEPGTPLDRVCLAGGPLAERTSTLVPLWSLQETYNRELGKQQVRMDGADPKVSWNHKHQLYGKLFDNRRSSTTGRWGNGRESCTRRRRSCPCNPSCLDTINHGRFFDYRRRHTTGSWGSGRESWTRRRRSCCRCARMRRTNCTPRAAWSRCGRRCSTAGL